MIFLRCGAPNPDPKRPSDQCNSMCTTLPSIIGDVVFAGNVKRIPDEPDGKIYCICPRCKTVNKWVFVAPARTLATDETIARLQNTS